nr:hypothetical protein [uncultured bacterium]
MAASAGDDGGNNPSNADTQYSVYLGSLKPLERTRRVTRLHW